MTHDGTIRLRILAVLLDALCLAVFVLAGRESHDLSGGPQWFLTVFWPFAAGWFAAALLNRLYFKRPPAWFRLARTWALGTALSLLLRIVLTGRSTPLPFVIVAALFIGATTAGWRIALLLTRTLLRAR